MNEQLERTALLLGEVAMEKLARARVAVFGVGGVGGFAAEALARSGVGALDLIDNDTVALSNLNRQIIALHSTVGQDKVSAMAARIRDINPAITVRAHRCFFMPDNASAFDFTQYDYVIDAIDTVTAKLELVLRCRDAGTPIISAMGAGNKLDPTRFEVADIYKTSVCPLARVMRQELKKRGVRKLKVVYSKEEPRRPQTPQSPQIPQTVQSVQTAPPAPTTQIPQIPQTPQSAQSARRSTPGSTAFCPSVCGLILAAEVVRDLSGA